METPAALIISGATIIDGASESPIEGRSIWIEGGRIKAIARHAELGHRPEVRTIDASRKYIIPGLMNANVHLMGCGVLIENIIRRMGSGYEDIITESAQIALKNGLTTVFDTHGPRRFLMAVRDRINAGQAVGSRFFCAGNIIGFDGPFSADFFVKASEIVSGAFTKRVNSIWVENVGRHLMWLTPDQVAKEIRTYIRKGIDFVKYASSDHFPGAFLTFSPSVQAAIVEEAHRAGLTAQAHSMSVEGLRIAVEAGCDLVTHCNLTGPTPIPESTLELMARRKTGAVIFPWTQKGIDWLKQNVSDTEWTMWHASDTNARNLIRSGAPLLLANDGTVPAQERLTEPNPMYRNSWVAIPDEEGLKSLANGHFFWFRAMEEKGCPPMEILRAATKHIAVAYGKDKDLGTLEKGKIADLLVLDKNPLEAAQNYRSIHMILKDGAIVDRDALPQKPVLTKPLEHAEEEASYIPFLSAGRFPMCPDCRVR